MCPPTYTNPNPLGPMPVGPSSSSGGGLPIVLRSSSMSEDGGAIAAPDPGEKIIQTLEYLCISHLFHRGLILVGAHPKMTFFERTRARNV